MPHYDFWGINIVKMLPILLFFLQTIAVSESEGQNEIALQKQSISFFKGRDCLNSSLLGMVYETGDLTGDFGSALSFAINGLWRMDYCGPYVPGGGCKRNIWKFENVCSSRSSNLNYNFTYVERYGNAFQNGSELILFPQDNFNGELIKSDGYGLDFVNTVTIKSWFFTGNNDWAIFTGPNYTGVKTCLKPNAQIISTGYGFTYHRRDLRTVGSVLFTCDGSGSLPPTSTLTIPSDDGQASDSLSVYFFQEPYTLFWSILIILASWHP